MKIQALYNLRDCTGIVSGNDLHEFFYELVGDPSPSGGKEFSPAKLKGIKLELYNALISERFALVRSEISVKGQWEIIGWNLRAKEATKREHEGNKKEKNFRYQMVPHEAANIMNKQGFKVFSFECGAVFINPAEELGCPMIPAYPGCWDR